ncbi:hypothetical protein C2W62_04395 [Candidatus Entotheonella serta]|nr:hypothetical protein C2W62_04395 [Candidatus Entotheonella serta]
MKHRVRQGEHLSGIAAHYGLKSWRQLWDHPENASLRERRGDPNILYPGDHVFIPEQQVNSEQGTTEQRHHFRLTRPQLLLRLDVRELREAFNELANFRLQVGLEVRDVIPNEDGVIEEPIPLNAEAAILFMDELSIPLRIGHLDPVDEVSGQRERLRNLGYLEADFEEDQALLVAAVLLFQADYELECDGICGPRTQQKLVEIHGS